MLNMLKDWQGQVDINGKSYESVRDAQNDFKGDCTDIHIVLHSQSASRQKTLENGSESVYRITVKQYMTRKATPEFDFMAKWNNDNPMPLRVMTGEVVKETRGMIYMRLHGMGEKTITCMRCGRELTNPISRLYGIGPECIHKIPMFANIDIEEAERIRDELVNVTWEGWIIKSAILEKEEVIND